jgi:hypothetical protein
MLSLGLLYAIHAMARCPRGQAFVAYGRLVQGARESAGTPIGKAPLQGAFAAAAVVFLREHPEAQQSLVRLEKKQGKGHAWTILAQKRARAVYDLLQRKVAFDRATFLQ